MTGLQQVPTDIDSYLTALPEDARATLEALRRMIRSAAPGAVEGFSYGMPAFKYRGRSLVYLGAWKQHCALYGLDVEGHRDELAAYDTAKGTIRFPLGDPRPEALVRKLITARIDAIDAAAGRRRGRSGSAE